MLLAGSVARKMDVNIDVDCLCTTHRGMKMEDDFKSKISLWDFKSTNKRGEKDKKVSQHPILAD